MHWWQLTWVRGRRRPEVARSETGLRDRARDRLGAGTVGGPAFARWSGPQLPETSRSAGGIWHRNRNRSFACLLLKPQQQDARAEGLLHSAEGRSPPTRVRVGVSPALGMRCRPGESGHTQTRRSGPVSSQTPKGEERMAELSTPLVQRELTCIECLRTWLELAERWRLYLTDDDPPQAVAYCRTAPSASSTKTALSQQKAALVRRRGGDALVRGRLAPLPLLPATPSRICSSAGATARSGVPSGWPRCGWQPRACGRCWTGGT